MSSSVTPVRDVSDQALVYFDVGVSEMSADALVAQLQSLLDPSILVRKVDSTYLIAESWEDKTVVLAIGGGSCSEWENSLGETGMLKIQKYFKNKGKLILLCAAAYFSAAISSFQLSPKAAEEKKRILSLFPGKAIGPIFETDKPFSSGAARALDVTFKMNGRIHKGSMYYLAGCHFEIPFTDSHTEILGVHEGKPIAILSKTAFLCGLHPEFIWSEKFVGDPTLEKLAKELAPHEEFRQQIWTEIAKLLSLPRKI